MTRFNISISFFVCLFFSLHSAESIAATISIVNSDGANEGFNDPSSVAAVAGNSGTTLGQQRLNVFQAAADYWGSILDSSVEIKVQAAMDPLQCDASRAILGSAGPVTGFINFFNAPQSNTVYPVALANSLANTDLNGTDPEIAARFNSAVDNNDTCLSNHNWCYQIGGTCPENSTSLYDVVLHELGHGLGFLTFVDSDGQKIFDGNDNFYDDHFMRFLKNNASGKQWPNMTDAERYTSARNDALVWTGTNVANSSGILTAGRMSGLVKLYAPDPYSQGSSVSHWDISLSPDELMEPYSNPTVQDTLTKMAFKDMGWDVATLPILSSPYPINGATVSSYNASSRLLRINIANASICTIYYGMDSSTSASLSGAISGGYCSATVPYGINLTNDGTNYWHVEASNSEGTVRYPESGNLTFTASPIKPKVLPGVRHLLL